MYTAHVTAWSATTVSQYTSHIYANHTTNCVSESTDSCDSLSSWPGLGHVDLQPKGRSGTAIACPCGMSAHLALFQVLPSGSCGNHWSYSFHTLHCVGHQSDYTSVQIPSRKHDYMAATPHCSS
ncbi:hypothetical protein BD309DRAFT_970159 [Dichomitus squalens]|nr:hypothetical protein BD309DRAFT_970159 [Dichomitus squalens]